MTADLVAPLDAADPAGLDAQLCEVAGSAPPRSTTDVVLVVGPWLAGVSTLTRVLRAQLPDIRFVEADELRAGTAPRAVLFAVSAVAPLAESDCVLLDTAIRDTDLVIGVLTKIDVHRGWRAVLDADADLVGAHSARLRGMPWVGVAAERSSLGELPMLLRHRLGEATLDRRNRLRAWETHLQTQIVTLADAAVDRGAVALHTRRDELLGAARLTRAERGIALRSRIQQARVQLGYFARNRCASVRTELSEDVGEWGGLWPPGRGHHRAEAFEAYVRGRAADVVEEVDTGITEHLRDIATELDLPAPPVPAPAPVPDLGGPGLGGRALETQLMMLLGAGFGLGVALAADRLLAGLAPGSAALGAIGGALLGVVLTVWVVGIRDLLQDRARLDRWVGTVTAVLREHTEELVATRVLEAELDLAGRQARADAGLTERTARQVAAIDAGLRDRALAAARSQRAGENRSAALRRALDAVRAAINNQTNSVTNQ